MFPYNRKCLEKDFHGRRRGVSIIQERRIIIQERGVSIIQHRGEVNTIQEMGR